MNPSRKQVAALDRQDRHEVSAMSASPALCKAAHCPACNWLRFHSQPSWFLSLRCEWSLFVSGRKIFWTNSWQIQTMMNYHWLLDCLPDYLSRPISARVPPGSGYFFTASSARNAWRQESSPMHANSRKRNTWRQNSKLFPSPPFLLLPGRAGRN